jgi:plastocyanin
MTRRLVLVVPVALAALALAACGSSGGSKSGASRTATDGKVTVAAFDSLKFDVKTINASPGPLTITLDNKGAIEHTLKIDGTDLELKADGGKSATGTVTLKSGTYDFECTVPGHASAGMKGKVVVS